MSLLHECPKCLKFKIGVPLQRQGDSMVCPVCESVYWELSLIWAWLNCHKFSKQVCSFRIQTLLYVNFEE